MSPAGPHWVDYPVVLVSRVCDLVACFPVRPCCNLAVDTTFELGPEATPRENGAPTDSMPTAEPAIVPEECIPGSPAYKRHIDQKMSDLTRRVSKGETNVVHLRDQVG